MYREFYAIRNFMGDGRLVRKALDLAGLAMHCVSSRQNTNFVPVGRAYTIDITATSLGVDNGTAVFELNQIFWALQLKEIEDHEVPDLMANPQSATQLGRINPIVGDQVRLTQPSWRENQLFHHVNDPKPYEFYGSRTNSYEFGGSFIC